MNAMRTMRTSIAALTLVVGAALFAGCASAPTEPQTMRDPQADFAKFKTFALDASGAEGSGQAVSLVEGYIRTALAAEMTRKGYVQAEAGTTPDLRVDYEAAKSDKVKTNPFRIGVGVGGYGGNTAGSVGVSSSGVKNVTEGMLVVHVIDPARNAEVWRGSAARELGKGNIEQATVQAVVTELMTELPARNPQP
jgi:hypothetical protein